MRDINPLLRAILLIFCVLAVLQVQSQQDTTMILKENRVLIPGTDFSIIPPAYFQKIEQEGVLGFIHPGALSSIQIKVVEGIPYTYMAASVTEESMKQQGAKLLAKEDLIETEGFQGVMFLLSYSLNNPENSEPVEFERLMMLCGTYQTTIWIDANYPVQARALLYNVMRSSMLSVEF